MRLKLKYVKDFEVGGKRYTYYRRNGCKVRIEGITGSDEWLANYQAIHTEFEATRCVKKKTVNYGTVAWLVDTYIQKPQFRRLSARTRKDYAIYLDLVKTKYGTKDWNKLKRHHVIAIHGSFSETPRKADLVLNTLSILGETAIDRGLRSDNPAKGIKKFGRQDGFRPWNGIEQAWFLGACTSELIMTYFMLGLWTGQRPGDIMKMTWHDIHDNVMHITQNKGGEKVWIPIHSELQQFLGGIRKRGLTILATEDGSPYTDSGFNVLWQRQIKNLGLGAGDGERFGCTRHGLRKNASKALAEAGCSGHEIKAITGHTQILTDGRAMYPRSDAQNSRRKSDAKVAKQHY